VTKGKNERTKLPFSIFISCNFNGEQQPSSTKPEHQCNHKQYTTNINNSKKTTKSNTTHTLTQYTRSHNTTTHKNSETKQIEKRRRRKKKERNRGREKDFNRHFLSPIRTIGEFFMNLGV
jgi:hypothetical protein